MLYFQVSKHNDLYLFPPLPPQLAGSGLHVSHHASGESHLRFHSPIPCLSLGPLMTSSFSRTESVKDIIAKRQSLLSEDIDLGTLNKAGMIAVLKLSRWLGIPSITYIING